MARTAFLIAATLVAAWCAPVCAQTAAQTQDDKLLAALKQEQGPGGKKRSIVIFDTVVTDGGGRCPNSRSFVGTIVNGKLESVAADGTGVGFLQVVFGGVKLLRPGKYSLVNVVCRATSGSITLSGEHAHFQVQPSEIVNVGSLKLEYARDGFFARTASLKRSVTPLSDATVKYLNQHLPRTFARAVNRPMVVTAPTATLKR